VRNPAPKNGRPRAGHCDAVPWEAHFNLPYAVRPPVLDHHSLVNANLWSEERCDEECLRAQRRGEVSFGLGDGGRGLGAYDGGGMSLEFRAGREEEVGAGRGEEE